MNRIDYYNIKALVDYRNNPPECREGGSLNWEDINLRTTQDLQEMLQQYLAQEQPQAIAEVKALVDEMFEKFAEEDDNMIVLSAAQYGEDSRAVYEVDDPMHINFDGFEHRYNPFYFPIARDWERRKWNKEGSKDDERFDEYWDYIEKLCGALEFPGSPFEYAEDYYRDNNDALNEYWYGVIGIMKDYRLVSFVIRYDGMLTSEDSMKSRYNKIIAQL